MAIEVRGVQKKFHNFTALENLDLEIKSGELVALLGPSGSGKTTLLRIIAGLELPTTGKVLFDGRDTTHQTLQERGVGFVFQHYALFKHMTVFDNVAFGLRVRPRMLRPSEEEIYEKVSTLLRLVHIDQMHDRYPGQLSGGQRQRVALARSLAVEPKVLLLDEPFGALDAKVRKELRRWMRRLHDEIDLTSIFVTHDQEEAMEVADRVVVMSAGHIEQVGTPDDVYNAPSNSFVYDFLGNFNVFEGWRDEDGVAHISEYEVTNEAVEKKEDEEEEKKDSGWIPKKGLFSNVVQAFLPVQPPPSIKSEAPSTIATKTKQIPAGAKPVQIFARPHDMEVTKTLDDKEYIVAEVVHINPAGSLVKLELERKNGSIIQAEIPKEILVELELKKYDEVYTRSRETRVFE